jgi:MSHA biogenesis protein MshI
VKNVALFSAAQKDSQIGVDFLPDGVAVAQVQTGKKSPGQILRSEFVEADGQEAQVAALKAWVHSNNLQKTPCVCLLANDDCDVYQVEKPEVEDAEMIQAVSWKIKDLINYDVSHAVVDSYPMPESSKNKQQQVGVVAAREAIVRNYIDGIKASALALNALDIHELVRANLQVVQRSSERSLAVLTLTRESGLLSVYHDTDLYVSREFMIGIDQLGLATSEDESVFDALLLELQRSLDYFESYYGMGSVTNLRIFPQVKATEKMAMYLQNLSNFDIEFISFAGDDDHPGLEPHCFHAYCAALRGVSL